MPDYLGDVMRMGKGNKALKKTTNAYALDLINGPAPNFAKSWNEGVAGKWGAGAGGANLGYQQQGGNLALMQGAHDMAARQANRQAGISNLATGIGLKAQGWANNDLLKQAAQNIQNMKAGKQAQISADKAAMWSNLINSGMALAGSFAGGGAESTPFSNDPNSPSFYGPQMPQSMDSGYGQFHSNDYLGNDFYGPINSGSSGYQSPGYGPSW